MRGFIMPESNMMHYNKPNIGALPTGDGKDIFRIIMNTPKPNHEKLKQEADELEKKIFASLGFEK
ncbi:MULTISPECIES: hypothetical protein [Pseudobutyrivibrio]|uniref:Uncharacterized protein n=1 Tax=Pseudobutyrivibrio xylanivorans TaxID=185007 RepID=A0A1G5RRQ2_PSEXY|nr:MULTISPECIES: hypothetical protein [Pseudobutyrivibrio]SCZ76111.1 hypothetical protein SAMN02910350_00085 [Pseudobutyrivibrio xylanivorans]SDH91833.1 hypothetical protein SAMN05421493_105137 [Pseudobutyrivibrio sp. 49]